MPSAAILPASLTIPRLSNQSLSSCRALTGAYFFHPFSFSSYFAAAVELPSAAIICMGGGPRTFPGGVSKWQWKRMQAKKSKQLLKARLCRERQLYEMRKRAELKSAISELERPWEVVERSPVLFSVSADEQVKVLADRFQRPTGFDMWSERDGPQLFRSPDNLPSARFFPKGAVHSVKPYSTVTGKIADGGGGSDEGSKAMRYNDWIARGAGGIGTGSRVKRVLSESKLPENVTPDPGKSVDGDTGESLGSYCSNSEILLADSRKEEKEWHDQNHGLYRSDMEIGVTGLNKEEDEMAGEYGWVNSRSRAPHFSDSELELADSRMEGHKRAGSFRRRGCREGRAWNRDTHQSNSTLPAPGSRLEGNMMSDEFGRRSGRSSNQSSHSSDSRLQGQKLSGDFDGSRGGRVMAGGFSRRDGRGGYRSSYRSYSDSAVDNFSQHRDLGRSRDSRGSHSDRPVADWRMEAGDIAGSFGGRGGRSGNRDSYETYGSDMEIGVTGLNKEEEEMAGEYDWDNSRSRVPHFSDSELELADSRMEGHKRAGGFRWRGGREGRGWNRNTHQPNSTFPASGSRLEGNRMSDEFGRRSGRSSNQSSHSSDSRLQGQKLSVGFDGRRGGRMMAGGFSRRDGRGGRGGYRSSYRSYSDSAGDNFSRHRDLGRSPDSRGSHSDRPVADWRMEAGDIAESFGGRSGNRDSYETYSDHGSRVKGESFGRRGGRGRFHGSYDSDIDAGSSMAREMAGSFVRPGGSRGYKNAESFSTQLRLEGGGRGRRGRKWREEE